MSKMIDLWFDIGFNRAKNGFHEEIKMGCIVELTQPRMQIEFCGKSGKQKILIDLLIQYGDFDIKKLAVTLGVPVRILKKICDGKGCLVGEAADSLAQIFLIFFGQHFFKKFKLTRNFV